MATEYEELQARIDSITQFAITLGYENHGLNILSKEYYQQEGQKKSIKATWQNVDGYGADEQTLVDKINEMSKTHAVFPNPRWGWLVNEDGFYIPEDRIDFKDIAQKEAELKGDINERIEGSILNLEQWGIDEKMVASHLMAIDQENYQVSLDGKKIDFQQIAQNVELNEDDPKIQDLKNEITRIENLHRQKQLLDDVNYLHGALMEFEYNQFIFGDENEYQKNSNRFLEGGQRENEGLVVNSENHQKCLEKLQQLNDQYQALRADLELREVGEVYQGFSGAFNGTFPDIDINKILESNQDLEQIIENNPLIDQSLMQKCYDHYHAVKDIEQIIENKGEEFQDLFEGSPLFSQDKDLIANLQKSNLVDPNLAKIDKIVDGVEQEEKLPTDTKQSTVVEQRSQQRRPEVENDPHRSNQQLSWVERTRPDRGVPNDKESNER